MLLPCPLKSARIEKPIQSRRHGCGDLVLLTRQHAGQAVHIETGGTLLTTEDPHDDRSQQTHQSLGRRFS
jgi:hypothetical protein